MRRRRKLGTERQDITRIKVPMDDIKRKIKQHYVNEWKEQWSIENIYHGIRRLVPGQMPYLYNHTRRDQVKLTRILLKTTLATR